MRRLFALVLLSACPEPTRFLCDPATGADCPPANVGGGSNGVGGGSGGVGGGSGGVGGGSGGGSRLGCDSCSAQGLGTAACVQGQCVITCQPGTLPTGTGCELPVSVAVSIGSTCVRTAEGHVGCAGTSTLGRVPLGARFSALALAVLPELASTLTGSTSGPYCAATTLRHVYCWGGNTRGELGNGDISLAEIVPTRVAAEDLVTVTHGGPLGCAVRGDGGLVCWGSNLDHPNGFTTGVGVVTTPRPVDGLIPPLVKVRAKGYTVVGLTADGQAVGWGGTFLLAGDVRSPTDAGARPLTLPFRARTFDLFPAKFVVDVDGGLWVWGIPPSAGFNSPLVFNADAGPAGYSYEPLRTTAPPDVRDVCQGSAHVCVLTGSGAIWCWGDNTYGQLGDGSFVSRGTPLPVPNVTATSLGCSDDFTCATTAAGVLCWGRNNGNRFGTDLPARSPTPRFVVTLTP